MTEEQAERLIAAQLETNRLLGDLIARFDETDRAIRSIRVNWNHPLMRLVSRG